MYAEDDSEGIRHYAFVHITFGKGIADGEEMVQIPDVVPEQPASPQSLLLLKDLASLEKAPDDVLHNLPVLDCRKRNPVHQTVEELVLLEDVFHCVHLGTAEDETAGRISSLPDAFEHSLHCLEQVPMGFVRKNGLEFVKNHDEPCLLQRGNSERQEGHLLHVIRVGIPVQGNRLVAGSEPLAVEDEMRPVEEGPDNFPAFFRRGCHAAYYRTSKPGQKIPAGPDVEHVQAGDRGDLPFDVHVEQGVLDYGFFPGLWRFEDYHVFSACNEV